MSTSVAKSLDHSPKTSNKVGFGEKLAYGSGDFASNIIFSSMSAFLVFYYTDVVQVSAAAIGTIMLVSRLLDGIVDIIMGFIVDRTKTKYGKARPWLLRMSIPFGIAAVLLFSVPNIAENMQLIYIFITYNIVNIVYTSINVPYGVLNSLMTQDQYERSVVNIIRMIFSMFANFGITMITLPLVSALGGGPSGWTKAYLVFGIIAVALFFITFFFTKERVGSDLSDEQIEQKANVSVKEGLKGLIKNKYWILLTANGLVTGINMAVTMGVNIYYAQYILGDPNLVGILSMASGIPMIVGLFFLAPFVKRFGKRNVTIAGAVLTILGCVLTLINPTNVTWIIITAIIRGLGTSPGMGVGFAMIADTVEYGEWKTGNRTEGLIFSAQSYGGKAGQGLGAALIGWILAFGGYVGGAVTQSPEAITAIKVLFIFLPGIISILQVFILIPYKLDKEYPVILSELESRKGMN